MRAQRRAAIAVLTVVLALVVATGCGGSGSSGAPPEDVKAPSAVKMVCDQEIRTAVGGLLSLKTEPSPTASWADDVYTCTYDLPPGKLVLSVQRSKDDAAATRFYTSVTTAAHPGKAITGSELIGRATYQSGDGRVFVVKDNLTLTVDPRGLPARVGLSHVTRAMFAYSIASNVLACWTAS